MILCILEKEFLYFISRFGICTYPKIELLWAELKPEEEELRGNRSIGRVVLYIDCMVFEVADFDFGGGFALGYGFLELVDLWAVLIVEIDECMDVLWLNSASSR